jgi:hypothetical protein
MGTNDEVIVPVLAPAEVLAGIACQGMEPVFADLDSETMSLTPRTVVDQVTVHTKGVYVTPVYGVMGDWEALKIVTEPRGINLQVEGHGGSAKWERIAPGVRGMAGSLLEVDSQLIHGGADGFAETLAAYGIDASRMPEWRGKRRDYPGMAAIEKQVLVVEGWRDRVDELKETARLTARQGQLMFEDLRRPPVAAGIHKPRVRRAV